MITGYYSEITLIDFCPLHTFYWFSLFCRADITNITIFCTHLKICFPCLQIVLPKDFFFWQIYLLPFLQTFISNFFANISVQDFCMQIFLSKIFGKYLSPENRLPFLLLEPKDQARTIPENQRLNYEKRSQRYLK